MIDGAQAVQHMKVNVTDLDVDFYCFSGHKMYGPTGIGILYGKKEILDKMEPYQGGGDMIKSVTFEKTIYNDVPHIFEAGTPNIAGGIAFGAALDYMNSIGFENIIKYENDLLKYATEEIKKIDGIKIYGDLQKKTAVISFNIKNVHPYDIDSILDQMGIAVRTGHHCAQPIMDYFEIPGTVRASFSFYNTFDEIDIMIKGVQKAIKMLQ